jgi:ABC-type glutathione transport system ATPase component
METRPLLEARHLSKRYRTPGVWPSRKPGLLALDDVSFAIARASTVALLGRSGAGKTTLARCLCLLESADSGEIRFEGLPLTPAKPGSVERPIQMIVQDPGASLNPRFTAFEVVEEPLRIANAGKSEAHQHTVAELMDLTGIAWAWSKRKAWQFSGGQRARLAIARALAAKPRLVILDESLSGLDFSVRAQIVNLLLDLQRIFGLTYLLVTHDFELARNVADRVHMLVAGKLVVAEELTSDLERELVCI